MPRHPPEPLLLDSHVPRAIPGKLASRESTEPRAHHPGRSPAAGPTSATRARARKASARIPPPPPGASIREIRNSHSRP
ncbi:hypothetical protein PsYK624_008330 [Phanerochaete sordida]|uniref:Uncharacterized protein n=1 Tax=Phanerochaete sordida TaxID=48140 RepID=A0A9P3FX67_9APHY|nr:hypothetical protein PsYK624_008330 [Phanerochaete sordida]